MTIPLTHYGRNQLIVALILLAVAVFGAVAGYYWPAAVAAVVALAILAFFRDPCRVIPDQAGILLAPADGRITDIVELAEDEFIHGRAVRIGIFLSVFDVHINRAPCAGKVAYIQDHPGKCINALRAEAASLHNRANCLGLECPDHPAGRVMVKQITGAIARRIVCGCQVGDELAAGERFGMIKFGSRTELFLPVSDMAGVLVQPGDTVRAGTTIMVRYQPE